jgi:LmbE family N-acetylglucosaminyl deacetylase
LARARADEARCSAQALGAHPPILLGFPDGALGNVTDPTLLYRLTERLHAELERLRPDALLTWGPDGGMGHPDHRMVSNIVTQLVRAGAPGVPERLFYAFIPVEGFRAVYPSRGAPAWLLPQAKYLNARISYSGVDADASRRSMECHKTQYPEDVVRRVSELAKGVAELPLAGFSAAATDDLFR